MADGVRVPFLEMPPHLLRDAVLYLCVSRLRTFWVRMLYLSGNAIPFFGDAYLMAVHSSYGFRLKMSLTCAGISYFVHRLHKKSHRCDDMFGFKKNYHTGVLSWCNFDCGFFCRSLD